MFLISLWRTAKLWGTILSRLVRRLKARTCNWLQWFEEEGRAQSLSGNLNKMVLLTANDDDNDDNDNDDDDDDDDDNDDDNNVNDIGNGHDDSGGGDKQAIRDR